MKHAIIKEMNGKDLFLFSSALLLSGIAIVCFVFHAHLEQIPLAIIDFAEHHFIIFGFICLIASLVIFKSRYDKKFQLAVVKGQTSKFKARENGKHLFKIFNRSERKEASVKTTLNTIKVDKNTFNALKFHSNDVLNTNDERIDRYNDLTIALKLGNLYKEKVTIVFKELNGLRKIYTTVWQIDKEIVSLKGGVTLPTRSIVNVKF